MATMEERVTRLETTQDSEQEWRRDIIARMNRLEARMDRLDSNQRWTIGLLILIIIAVIGSNWLG